MFRALRSLWFERRAPRPAKPSVLDGVLAVAVVLLTLVEAVVRTDLISVPLAIGLSFVLALAVWRRQTHAFIAFVSVFTIFHLVSLGSLAAGFRWQGTHSTAFVLLLSYSVFRRGAGWECAVSLVYLAIGFVITVVSGEVRTVGETIGVTVVLLLPTLLGASVRFRALAAMQEREQAKLLERERLARELHDTIAHSISAIAIQAQAGRTLARTKPEAAVGALEIIEEAAGRALEEMRAMVHTLRRDDEASLTPQRGIDDVAGLAASAAGLPVAVQMVGELDDLKPSVSAAVYRLAQESITNAVRHARKATGVTVEVTGSDDSVRIAVIDDGEPQPFAATGGFGLLGMAERAALLGGSFQAGPKSPRGWTVEAVLPKKGPT